MSRGKFHFPSDPTAALYHRGPEAANSSANERRTPPASDLGGRSKPSVSKGKKEERERLRPKFFVEAGNDPLEFYLLIGLSLRELDPKCPGLDPSHLAFIDPQRLVKPRDVDAALKRRPHDNR
jgi:hypothetical protein